jgi:hypothetical protein
MQYCIICHRLVNICIIRHNSYSSHCKYIFACIYHCMILCKWFSIDSSFIMIHLYTCMMQSERSPLFPLLYTTFKAFHTNFSFYQHILWLCTLFTTAPNAKGLFLPQLKFNCRKERILRYLLMPYDEKCMLYIMI